MKRLISLALSSVMCLSTISGITALASEEENKSAEAAELAGIGVIKYPSVSDAWEQVYITNGDFMTYVMGMTDFAEKDSYDEPIPWENVSPGNVHYYEYTYAWLNRWLDKDAAVGAPEDELTQSFAIELILGVLGYMPIIDSASEKAAQTVKRDLLKGLKSRDGGLMTLNDAIMLLKNAIGVNYCSRTVNSKNEIIYNVKDKITILTHYKDIYMVEGRVNATAFATLTGTYAADNSITINSDNFEIQDFSYTGLIGRYVEGYALINKNEEKILWLTQKKSTQEIVIEGEDFNTYENGMVSYYVHGSSKLKTESVDNPILIYNGKQLKAGEYKSTMLDISDGDVTLLKTKGVIDVIIINKYKNLIVGSVDDEEYVIYDYVYSGVSLNLEPKSGRIISLIDSVGQKVDFSRLKKKSIITYTESLDGKYIYGIVGGTAITQSAETVEKESGVIKSVTVAGNVYHFTDEQEQSGTDIIIGMNYDMFINVNGRIAAVKVISELDVELGFMVRAIYDDSDSEIAKIKVMPNNALDEGDAVMLNCIKKLKIDGNATSPENVITSLSVFNGTTQIPIAYKLNNDGEVMEIDTPYYDNTKELKNTLRCVHSMDDATQITSKTARNWGYRNHFNGKWLMDYDGMVVVKNTAGEIFTSDHVRNDSKQGMDLYSMDIESPFVYFAVLKDEMSTSGDFEEQLAIVKRVYQGINSEEEVSQFVDVIISSKEYTYEFLHEKEALAETIAKGDMIKYKLDTKDRLLDIQMLLDYSDIDSSVGYMNNTWIQGGSARIVVGKMYSVAEAGNPSVASGKNVLSFYTDSNDIEGSSECVYSRAGCVFKYSVNDGEITVTELDVNDIKTYKTVGNNADIILMNTNFSVPVYIYVISRD